MPGYSHPAVAPLGAARDKKDVAIDLSAMLSTGDDDPIRKLANVGTAEKHVKAACNDTAVANDAGIAAGYKDGFEFMKAEGAWYDPDGAPAFMKYAKEISFKIATQTHSRSKKLLNDYTVDEELALGTVVSEMEVEVLVTDSIHPKAIAISHHLGHWAYGRCASGKAHPLSDDADQAEHAAGDPDITNLWWKKLDELGYSVDVEDIEDDAFLKQLAIEYSKVYIGPGPHVAPYGSIHHPDDPKQGRLWGDSTIWVRRFIKEHGLDLGGKKYDGIPDHIGHELELFSLLVEGEASAREQEDPAGAERVVNSQRLFVEKQLGRWVPEFTRKVAEAANLPFYEQASKLACDLIEEEEGRLAEAN